MNVDIPEIKTMLERTRGTTYEIQVRNLGQGQQEVIETTIKALAGIDPAKTMKKV